jgi:hypothetical protein
VGALSSLALKLIAVVTMIIDHMGYALAPMMPAPLASLAPAMRLVGRLAMPLFCFLIAEGYFHTRSPRRYLMRLSLFALLSEVPYDLLFARTPLEFSSQNVFFTLALSLAAIWLYDRFEARGLSAASLLSLLVCAALCELLRSDYGAIGVLFTFVFYRFRGQPAARAAAFLVADAVLFLYSLFSRGNGLSWSLFLACAAFALIPISLYNGEKGHTGRHGRFWQLFFYAFYPAHLLLLSALAALWARW